MYKGPPLHTVEYEITTRGGQLDDFSKSHIWTPGFDSPIFSEIKTGFRLKKFGKLILPPQFYETRYVFFFSTHKPYFTTIYTNSIDYNFTSNWPRTMILYAKTTF